MTHRLDDNFILTDPLALESADCFSDSDPAWPLEAAQEDASEAYHAYDDGSLAAIAPALSAYIKHMTSKWA